MSDDDLRARLRNLGPRPDEINPAAIDPHGIERQGRRRRRRRAAGVGAPLVIVVAAAVAVPLAVMGPSAPDRVTTLASPSVRSPAVTATVTASPNTGLVAGQQVRVSVAGFPQHATVSVYECAAVPVPGSIGGCGPAGWFGLYTGDSDRASGTYTARPAAGLGPNGPEQECHEQCVLVAVMVKQGTGQPRGPAPMAFTSLSFTTTAPPSLMDTALRDMSWTSTTDGWALASQPCLTGTCPRLAHTTDGGAHWSQLPDPPAQLQDGTVDCSVRTCVSNIWFASPTIGYLYGPGLLATTDGGRTWQSQPGLDVETLAQQGAVRRPSTVRGERQCLIQFAEFLAARFPEVTSLAVLRREHVEAYKLDLATRAPLWRNPHPGVEKLSQSTIYHRLLILRNLIDRLQEQGSPDAPRGKLVLPDDLPIKDRPLPRFIDDAAFAKLLVAARADPDLFIRLAVEFLARTGLRVGEFLDLTTDAVVQIGSGYWLRVPIGKLHNDRYIPLHPQLKELLDEWLAGRAPELRTSYLFMLYGRRVSRTHVATGLGRVAERAGIGHVTPHQLRHTLATQAINRGHVARSAGRSARPQDPGHDPRVRPDRRSDRR